jgi:hypothetical protein
VCSYQARKSSLQGLGEEGAGSDGWSIISGLEVGKAGADDRGVRRSSGLDLYSSVGGRLASIPLDVSV